LIPVVQASENTEELNHLTMFLLELCLLDYKMLKWLPSVTSAAALYLARRMMNLPTWVCERCDCGVICQSASVSLILIVFYLLFPLPRQTPELQRATCYGEAFLRACVADIHATLTQPDPKEEAVRKKYSSTKYKCVSKVAPCESL
jgi:hypothetical protein